MNIKEIHPVRAALAIGAWAAVIYMMIAGIAVPDAGWAMVGAITAFYFTSN